MLFRSVISGAIGARTTEIYTLSLHDALPIRITVDSPMTAADHVKSIHLYSERNPVPNMANFYLGSRAGKAEINSRVRLAGSQRVTAVAKLSDGSFWYDAAPIVVTLSACLDES